MEYMYMNQLIRKIKKRLSNRKHNSGETYIETVISIVILAMTVTTATQAMTVSTRIIAQYEEAAYKFGWLNSSDKKAFINNSENYDTAIMVSVTKVATMDDANISVNAAVPIAAKTGMYHLAYKYDVSKIDSLFYYDISISE